MEPQDWEDASKAKASDADALQSHEEKVRQAFALVNTFSSADACSFAGRVMQERFRNRDDAQAFHAQLDEEVLDKLFDATTGDYEEP